uniref:3'-5' exonuclease domain-containing protein n=1 Tax=Mycena chlorophos TaxID=658473 RepID=A0ABQ0M7V3_MYCCL|nr:predicted protein [Mycena chlorophos]
MALFASTFTASNDSIVLVDTLPTLMSCIEVISQTSSLAVDLEGIDLCRSGTLCLMQLKAKDNDAVWLVDIVALGANVFNEAASDGTTLKAVLESHIITKLFYDVRNDSDALYNLFGISLANVYDLQLLELAFRATRPGSTRAPRFLTGLLRALEEHVAPSKSFAVTRQWTRIKEAGLKLFAPDKGGRYEVFAERPLAPELIDYCAQDVAFLHDLDAAMRSRVGTTAYARGNWEKRIRAESMVRVGYSRQRYYVARGPEKAIAPANW